MGLGEPSDRLLVSDRQREQGWFGGSTATLAGRDTPTFGSVCKHRPASFDQPREAIVVGA